MMAPKTGLLGPAMANWNDFVGSAAADELELADANPSLYQVAGLSPSSWLVAAVDLEEQDDERRLCIYAFCREASGVTSYADLLEYASRHGEIPVVGFELTRPPALTSGLGHLFGRMSVRLVARGLKDLPLAVTRVESR